MVKLISYNDSYKLLVCTVLLPIKNLVHLGVKFKKGKNLVLLKIY
jgi:hypothetical protein